MQPGSGRRPFFLAHMANGWVFEYVDLVRRLPNDQPVYGLQSVGLDRTRRAGRSIAGMIDSYTKAIREVQPTGPYRLGGYCYGAPIALEIAGRLRQEGDVVDLLAIFELCHWRGDRPPYGWRATWLDRAKARVDALRHATLSERWESEHSEEFRLNMTALRSHRLHPIPVPVTLFVMVEDAEEEFRVPRYWTYLAGGGVDVERVLSPGANADNALLEPHAERVAAALTRRMSDR
jgi:thioesterase domain-containing protein